MKKEGLMETISSAEEIKDELQTSVSDAKQGKLKVGAVVRLIVLIIAWINQVAAAFGSYEVPNVSPSVVYIIATVITISVTLYSYWKNNSWSLNAKTADAILEVLRETGITSDEVVGAIGTLVDEYTSKRTGETDAEDTAEEEPTSEDNSSSFT